MCLLSMFLTLSPSLFLPLKISIKYIKRSDVPAGPAPYGRQNAVTTALHWGSCLPTFRDLGAALLNFAGESRSTLCLSQNLGARCVLQLRVSQVERMFHRLQNSARGPGRHPLIKHTRVSTGPGLNVPQSLMHTGQTQPRLHPRMFRFCC